MMLVVFTRRLCWIFTVIATVVPLVACTPRAESADAARDSSVDGSSDDSVLVDASDASTACRSEDAFAWGRGGIDMLPGSDCLSCHRADGSAGSSVFSAAGTVFVSPSCRDGRPGATVILRDSTGREVRLTTSERGNFATTVELSPPLSARVAFDGGQLAMRTDVDHGSCNSCHRVDRPLGLIPAP
jgi:hypothetical protein